MRERGVRSRESRTGKQASAHHSAVVLPACPSRNLFSMEKTMILATVDPTTVGMLLTACGILGSAVGFLYKQQSQFHKDTSEKLRDCESDRVALWAELAKQAGRKIDELKKELSSD